MFYKGEEKVLEAPSSGKKVRVASSKDRFGKFFSDMKPGEVVKDRIGCYGPSMGSTHTWLVGPWEPRLKCLVGNC